jgi:hypothetical protein
MGVVGVAKLRLPVALDTQQLGLCQQPGGQLIGDLQRELFLIQHPNSGPERLKTIPLFEVFLLGSLFHLKAEVVGRPKDTVLPVLDYYFSVDA